VASIWLKEEAKLKHVGEAYAEVVGLCLECSFTPVRRNMTLANEEFREAVCRRVVQRLETVYDTYTKALSPTL
jgi:hypothetical protein